MNTKQPGNRVETALEQWKQKEERFTQLFPMDVTKNLPFLKEKLQYLERLGLQFARSAHAEERISLQMVQAEIKRLSATLYPNRWLRLFRYYIVKPLQHKLSPPVVTPSRAEPSETVSVAVALRQTGFGDFIDQVQKQMQPNMPRFSLPVSYFIENDKMDFELRFNNNEGHHTVQGYQATLHSNGETRTHFFSGDHEPLIDGHQAYNLLCGRSVCVTRPEGGELWTKLDFSDADTAGNCKLRYYRPHASFDLSECLSALSVERLATGLATGLAPNALEPLLKNGDRVGIVVSAAGVEKTMMIEANPQKNCLNYFDRSGRRLSSAEALGKANPTKSAASQQHLQQQKHRTKRVKH